MNPWISFLRNYGPIASSDNMYDETIQARLKEFNCQPINIEIPLYQDLEKLIESNQSLILTGTAGDGKTFACRKLWEQIAKADEAWDPSQKVMQKQTLFGEFFMIKDLSEMLHSEQKYWLEKCATRLEGEPVQFVIAANDGQLIEALQRLEADPQIKRFKRLVEDQLLDRKTATEPLLFQLRNFSRLDTKLLAEKVIDGILEHEEWKVCNKCSYSVVNGSNKRCPIIENKERLADREAHFRSRLLEIIQLTDANDMHLPIRQLFILVVNILLGSSRTKERLMNCQRAKTTVTRSLTEYASPYANVFGYNLKPSERDNYAVFRIFSNFNIGRETANAFDDLLIYGQSDDGLSQDHQKLMVFDQFYGISPKYEEMVQQYVEGSREEGFLREFLKALERQRQRLFFTIPEALADYPRWTLTCYHFAGHYLNLVRNIERQENNNDDLHGLILGMNRVFTGMMGTEDQRLHICETGAGLSVRINRVHREELPLSQRFGGVSLGDTLSPDQRPYLVFDLNPTDPKLKKIFELRLIHFEYLHRIKQGGLPTSYSHQCYEDLLSLKIQILAVLQTLDSAHGGQSAQGIALIDVNQEGHYQIKKIETKGSR